MDVLQALRQDHEAARRLFSRIEQAQGRMERDKLFRKLKQELTAHARIEEKFFYPELQSPRETTGMVEEGLEEHHQVERLLENVAALDTGSREWLDRMRELKQMVEHHVVEEERDLFPKAQALLTDSQVGRLAGQVERGKEEIR